MALAEDVLTPQQRHVEQLRLQPAPAPVQQPQVVDRVAYLQEQAQKALEMRQQVLEIQRQLSEQRQAQAFQALMERNAGVRAAVEAQGRYYEQQGVIDRVNRARAATQGFQSTDPRTGLDIRTLSMLPPSQAEASLPSAQGIGPGGALSGLGAVEAYKEAAQLPTGLAPVNRAIRGVLEPTLEQVARTNPSFAPAQFAGEKLPYVPTSSGVAAGVASNILPEEWWQAGLELLPGIGSVPGASSALGKAAREAGFDLTPAGIRAFVKSEGVQGATARILRAAMSESGRLRLPGSAKTVAWQDLRTAPDVLDAPVVAYHGTGLKFSRFDEGLMDTTALYGPGVYMTDDTGIARTYADKQAAHLRRRSAETKAEVVIQTLRVRSGVRVLNMERPLPPDAAQAYKTIAAELDAGEMVDDAIARGVHGSAVNKALRDALYAEHIPDYEAGDVLASLNYRLQRAGYDGIAHVGGIQGGKKHTVTVIFDPANVEVITPTTRALAIWRGLQSEVGTLGKMPDEAEWLARMKKQGKLFHGSAADPSLGRASLGDESGFFTVEEPSIADFYANSDIRNAEAGKGRIYVADPPKRPLVYGEDTTGQQRLYGMMKVEADRLYERDLNYGDVKPPGRFVRAVAAIPDAIASGNPRLIDSAFRNASLEYQISQTGSFTGAGRYLNKLLKEAGYDAFVTLEKNPALGPDAPYHRVVAYMDRPKLTSYQDYVRGRRASESGALRMARQAEDLGGGAAEGWRLNTVDGVPRKPDVRSADAEVWQRQDGSFDVVDRKLGGSIVDLGDQPKGFDVGVRGGPEDGGNIPFRVRPDPREPVVYNYPTRRQALDAYEQIKRGETPPKPGAEGAAGAARQAEDVGGGGSRTFEDIAKEARRLRDEAGEVQALRQELKEAAGKPRVTARIQKMIAEAEAKGQQADRLNAQLDEMSGGRKWRVTSHGFGVAAPVDTTVITAPTEELARMRATLAGIPAARIKAVEEIPATGIPAISPNLGIPIETNPKAMAGMTSNVHKGVIEVDPVDWAKLSPAERSFYLVHEEGHFAYDQLSLADKEELARLVEEPAIKAHLGQTGTPVRPEEWFASEWAAAKTGTRGVQPWHAPTGVIDEMIARSTVKPKPTWRSGATGIARQAEDLGGATRRELVTDIPKPVVEKLAIKRRIPTIDAWNALPQEDRQLIEALADSIPTRAERRTALEAQHMRQGAKAEAAFTSGEGTTIERAQRAFKQMGGKQAQRFEPVAHRFDGPQIDSYFSRIDDAVATKKIGAQFEGPRATSALHLLFYGTRLPNVVSEARLPLNLMPKEIELLGRIFGPEFEAVLPRTAEELSKFQLAIDVLNAPRSLITAIDVSAAGRQGILLATRNPKEWAASWRPMIEAMGSPEGFDRVATELRASPHWDDALFHGLDITDIGGGSTAEEFFVNRITERIPGVQMSERGFTMFLDYLRMKTYEKYAVRLERTAAKWNWEPQRLTEAKRQTASFLNHATGRGDLSGVSSFIPALNAVFFSPRYLASRAQVVWDLVKPGVDPAVRQITAENIGAFMAMGTTALGLLAATGVAAVELDPRSSDFGKVKVGDQRIEFWGGFQPLARFVAQTAMGERKELFTGDFVKTYRGETVLRFIRSKLSPGGSLAYDLLVNRGRTFEGDKRFFVDPSPKSAWNEFQRTFFPLWIQDMVEAYKTQGLGAGVTAGAISAVGGGVGTFSASEGQQKDIAQSGIAKELEQIGYPDFNRFFEKEDGFRKAIAGLYGVDKTDFGTMADLKEYVVDRDWKNVRDAEGKPVSEPVARQLVGQRFDEFPAVKEIRDSIRQGQIEVLRQHPDLAQKMADAGMLGTLSKDEREILGLE